jgi:acyl-CoA thioester hydrolase
MWGLRDHIGWDLATLNTLPFMVWARRLEIDFVRPAQADQEIIITSFVREFRGPDAYVECTMADSAGKTLARCLMIVAYVDKGTSRGASWPAEVMTLFFEPDPPDVHSPR